MTLLAGLPRLYTETELANALAVSEATLARARRAGKLPYTRVGNRVRYTADHLAAYLERQQCGTTSSSAAKSGTSAGPSQMAPQDAHQLAREISAKLRKPLPGTSSKTTGRETNN